MHISPFAGLTVPDPDDPALTVDGGSFATENPDLTDHFLSIGCVSHRHNAHPALPDPTMAPSAAVVTTGGTIASDTSIYLGYTVTDNYGGETRLSPVVNVTTPQSMAAPSAAPTVAFDSTGGVMPVGDYGYALTIMDAGGGETTVGPTNTVNRPPGYASGQMQLTGLAAFLVNPGDQWRLWRADNGGALNLIAVGTSNTFTDYGIDPVDHAATPPATNSTTLSTNMIEFTLPPAGGASGEVTFGSGSAINVYMSIDGTFVTPSLYQTYPIASAGATIDITGITVDPGSPPRVSRSIPGAHLIDPDTELIDWHWKRPVDTAADLPTGSATSSGDVRVTTDTGEAWAFTASGWVGLGLRLTVEDTFGDVVHGVNTLEFVGSGGASATVSGSGSTAIITIMAAGGGADVDPADTDTDIAIGRVFDTHGGEVDNATAIEFVGSGGASATVAASGASAIVTITGGQGPAGPAGPAGSGSSGSGSVTNGPWIWVGAGSAQVALENFSTNTSDPPAGFTSLAGTPAADTGYLYWSAATGNDALARWDAGGNVSDTWRVTGKVRVGGTNCRWVTLIAEQPGTSGQDSSLGLNYFSDGTLQFTVAAIGNWSQGPTSAGPAWSGGADVWLRITRQGNTVVGELFNADPAGGATAINTITYALPSGDQAGVGAGTAAKAAAYANFIGTPDNTTRFYSLLIEKPGGFSNSWRNFGTNASGADASGSIGASYRKDGIGKVTVRGTIASGTVGLPAFTLASGYRPIGVMKTACPASGAYGELEVRANGDVVPVVGSTSRFDLETAFFTD